MPGFIDFSCKGAPMSASVQSLVSQPYKYGFTTDIEADVIPRGLSEEVVRLISAKKNEPEFMLQFRLKAYRRWLTMAEPTWPNVSYPAIDYQKIIYSPPPRFSPKSWAVWRRSTLPCWKPLKSWAFP